MVRTGILPLMHVALGSSLLLACESGPTASRVDRAVRPAAVPAPGLSVVTPSRPPAQQAPQVALAAPRASRYTLTREPPSSTPWSLSAAVPDASKRFASPKSRQSRASGCGSPLIVQAQGYWGEAPAWATLELTGKSVRLTVIQVDTGARTRYRGTLEQSLCDHVADGDLLGMGGTLRAEGGGQPDMQVSLNRNSYLEIDRGRLRFEGTRAGETEPAFRFWDTPDERQFLRDRYQKALNNADDVEVVLERSQNSLVVASLGLDGREVTLTQLAKKSLLLQKQQETSMLCNYHECHVKLSGHEVNPELTLLVVVTHGEDCGAKCTSKAEAQLWTLTPSGFHSGAELPSSDEMPGGLNYEGRSSHTSLCWIDADGAPPLEVLGIHTDTEQTDPSVTVYGYDPATGSYSNSEPQPGVTREGVDKLCVGGFTEF
jgi:hypothetical protein